MEHEQPKHDSIGREILLEVGAEGGSIYIARFKHTDQTWRYVCVINETVMADFEEFASNELYKESGVVTTFEEALKMMDKYPWPKLYPLLVHPEYAGIVGIIVEKAADGYTKEDWKRILGK